MRGGVSAEMPSTSATDKTQGSAGLVIRWRGLLLLWDEQQHGTA